MRNHCGQNWRTSWSQRRRGRGYGHVVLTGGKVIWTFSCPIENGAVRKMSRKRIALYFTPLFNYDVQTVIDSS